MATFAHHDLHLLNPAISSPLMDVLFELDYLRRLEMQGSTDYRVFDQLRGVFHILESLASARIEGNHTTLAEIVETRVGIPAAPTDTYREITNIETAVRQIEKSVAHGTQITEATLRALHATTVEGLTIEGDRTPGAYREGYVGIANADHQPPEAIQVQGYMRELVEFINREDAPKYDLMKVALAHHRFAWVHPFGNGNGRVVRLLTYALLIKYGFRVRAAGRLLNPAAIFCANRSRYYEMLATADTGTDEALEAWCLYALTGIRDELKKMDRLADHRYLTAQILLPALAYARERQLVTSQEASILTIAIQKGVVKATDLAASMQGMNSAQRTYQVRKLVQNGMLRPIRKSARQYTIGFMNNQLLRGVVAALTSEGFISAALSSPAVPEQARRDASTPDETQESNA